MRRREKGCVGWMERGGRRVGVWGDETGGGGETCGCVGGMEQGVKRRDVCV